MMKILRVTAIAAVSIVAAILLSTCSENLELFQQISNVISSSTAVYRVIYDGNEADDGTIPTDLYSYSKGSAVTVMGTGTMSRTDYNFISWNTEDEGGGDNYLIGDTFAMPASDVILYAQWTADPTYSVIYDGNGSDGGIVPSDSNRYTDGSTVTVLGPGSMTRNNYAFLGWNTADDGDGTDYGTSSTFSMPASDVTLYALWEYIPTFTVTYDGNDSDGGTLPVDSNQYEEDDLVYVKAAGVTRTGYTFEYWAINSDGTGDTHLPSSSFPMGTENVTLYAHWSINTYTVTFYSNNATTGSAPAPVDYEYGATVTVPTEGTLDRYDSTYGIDCGFNGWCTTPDGNGDSYGYVESGYVVDRFLNILPDSFTMPDHDVSLYAFFNFFGGIDSHGNVIIYDDCDLDIDNSAYLYYEDKRFLAIAPLNEDLTNGFAALGLVDPWTTEWGPTDTRISSVSPDYPVADYGIGKGKLNTDAIVAVLGNNDGTPYAAKYCYDLIVDGYSDYFLPSRRELEMLHKVWKGWLFVNSFWTSTENYTSTAESWDFGDADETNYDNTYKDEALRIYPMTYFGTRPY